MHTIPTDFVIPAKAGSQHLLENSGFKTISSDKSFHLQSSIFE